MTRSNCTGPQYDAPTAADFDKTKKDNLLRREHGVYCWNASSNSSRSSVHPALHITVDKAKADLWPKFAVPSSELRKADRYSTKKGQTPYQPSCRSFEKTRTANESPLFGTDDVSTESSLQCPAPQPLEKSSELKSAEALRKFQERCLHQYLWQVPSKPYTPDSALSWPEHLPHLAPDSYGCGKRKKHVPYKHNWHEDSRMGTKAGSRQPQVVNDEIWDVESFNSELCAYPIFECTKADPCSSVAKTKASGTGDLVGALHAEMGEISGASRTSPSLAEQETINTTEEFIDQDPLRSSARDHVNHLSAHMKGNSEEIETEVGLSRSSAPRSSAQSDKRENRSPNSQSDREVTPEASLTIEQVDVQPTAEEYTKRAADDVTIVRTRHVIFWAFQILVLLVQTFVIIFISGESICSYLKNFWGLVTVTLPAAQIAAFTKVYLSRRLLHDFGVMFLTSVWFGSVSKVAVICEWVNREAWTVKSLLADRAFVDGAYSVGANAPSLANKPMSSSHQNSVASAVNSAVLADTIEATVLNTTSILLEMLAVRILNGTFSDEIKTAAADAARKIVNVTVAELSPL